VPRGTRDGRSHVEGVSDDLAIEVDEYGSPVSIEPVDWLVCFVPGLTKQWWHRFVDARHKHVFALRMMKDGNWILVEPWWTRMMVTVVPLDEAVKFLRWGAAGDILQVREAIPGKGDQARGWANCVVLTAFLLGRSYWTWTPHGLYRRLAAEKGARHIDAARSLADHFQTLASQITDHALGSPAAAPHHEPLDQALLRLAQSIMSAVTSPSALALYKVAISESGHFGSAAHAYWEYAPKRAIEKVRETLEEAQTREGLRVQDLDLAARQFVALLRGDLHLQILFQGRPDAVDIQRRAQSVVDMFLRGVSPQSRSPATDLSAARSF
jgi:hypothetical protein